MIDKFDHEERQSNKIKGDHRVNLISAKEGDEIIEKAIHQSLDLRLIKKFYSILLSYYPNLFSKVEQAKSVSELVNNILTCKIENFKNLKEVRKLILGENFQNTLSLERQLNLIINWKG